MIVLTFSLLQLSAFKFQPSLFLLFDPPWIALCGKKIRSCKSDIRYRIITTKGRQRKKPSQAEEINAGRFRET